MNALQTPIRFLDLSIKDEEEECELSSAFSNHLKSGRFLISDAGETFEEEFATLHNRSFCIGVNTGTDALTIGIRLLGLAPKSYVITTPFSWIASTSCLLLNNLQPLFVDIDDKLQIDLMSVRNALDNSSHRISAILVPHLHGNVTSLLQLNDLRKAYGVAIIEDCAQSFAARDSDGNLAGTIGNIAAFSFNPMKVLGALGDAGAILFDDETFLHRAKSLRHSGTIGTLGLVNEVSSNCRLDALQASILRVRLKYFATKLNRRMQICKLYNESLADVLQPITDDIDRSNHYCYQSLCDQRDDLLKYLVKQGIEARVRHDFLIPEHPAFSGFEGYFPNAKRLVGKTLCLPMHHNLSDSDIQYIIRCVRDFYNA